MIHIFVCLHKVHVCCILHSCSRGSLCTKYCTTTPKDLCIWGRLHQFHPWVDTYQFFSLAEIHHLQCLQAQPASATTKQNHTIYSKLESSESVFCLASYVTDNFYTKNTVVCPPPPPRRKPWGCDAWFSNRYFNQNIALPTPIFRPGF